MFIDLVVCTLPVDNKKYLYEAPRFSNLEQGDNVILDDADGKRFATVVDCVTVTKDDEKYRFIANALGATLPLGRIAQKVIYQTFVYKEDEE